MGCCQSKSTVVPAPQPAADRYGHEERSQQEPAGAGRQHAPSGQEYGQLPGVNSSPDGRITLSGQRRQSSVYATNANLNEMARDLLSRQRRHSVATPFHQAEWEGLVRGHSRCMAITTKRQPCSRAAAEAFLIYSYNHMQARGDSDDATALPALQAALCVCTQHGNSGFLAKDMGAAAEKVYPCTMDPETVGRVLNGMQTHRLTVCGKHFAGFHQVRPEDLRSTLSAGSSAWKGLMKQAKRIRAPKCAGVKANGNICTAAPRDVYVVQRSGGDGGGNGGGGGPVQLQCQPVLLFACGNHKLPTGRLYNPDAGQSVELSRLLLDHLANPDAADTAQLPGDLVPHAHDYP